MIKKILKKPLYRLSENLFKNNNQRIVVLKLFVLLVQKHQNVSRKQYTNVQFRSAFSTSAPQDKQQQQSHTHTHTSSALRMPQQ